MGPQIRRCSPFYFVYQQKMVKFSISKTNIFRIGLNTRLRVILNDFNFFVKSYYILVGASSTTSAIVITQSIVSLTR